MSGRIRVRWLVLGSLAVVLAGVAALVALPLLGRAPGAPTSPELAGSRLTLELRPDHPLIAEAAIELPAPRSVYVEYGGADLGWLRTPASGASTAHRIPIVRLRPETRYEVRAFALDADGSAALIGRGEVSSGPVPAPLQQSLSRVEGAPSFGVAIMDHRGLDKQDNWRVGWLVAVDGSGTVVWYYQVPGDLPLTGPFTAPVSIKRRPNGNFIYAAGPNGFEEISPDARSVRRIPIDNRDDKRLNHHDFLELPDGRLVFPGSDDRTVVDASSGQSRLVRGDTLYALDPRSGHSERVWSSFDFLDPTRRPQHWQEREDGADDWTHLNTISLGPRGNLVLSLRNLDLVLSMAPDLRSVEWRLGGVDSSFAFPDASDRFYGPHTAREVAPGRVLMFDNGPYRPEGDFSRGLELELDFATMTARKAWEFRYRPDFFSRFMSSAERLPNGNTLLNFGTNVNARNGLTLADYGFDTRQKGEPVLAVEVGPDGARAWEHWLIWTGARATRYRVQPFPSLAGETSVQPTPIADAAPRR